MAAVDEVTKKIMENDIKDLPTRLTPRDIYEYMNKDNHIIGWHAVYELSREIGHRFKKGGRIYINKTDFIKYVYGGRTC